MPFFRRATTSTWLLLEQTAAATIAWLISIEVLGHEAPFFAPAAAVVALNANLGERGVNALRLLLGVVIGICVGEITILVLGVGYGRLAVATFASMAISRALDESRVVIAQAAGSAILTVAALNGATVGLDRLEDAFVGGGVALVFTQILFTPDPLALVQRAEAAGLTAIASNLRLAGRALERDDVAPARHALENMRDVRNRLVDLEQAMIAAPRVRRTSVLWRARRDAVDREAERARRLDLLGTSSLLLARTALSIPPAERALAAAPEDPNALLMQGSLALGQGRRDEAAAALAALEDLPRPTISFLLGGPEELRRTLDSSSAGGSTTTSAPGDTRPSIPNPEGG